MLVRCQRAAGKGTAASWGYVGSANLSESGWYARHEDQFTLLLGRPLICVKSIRGRLTMDRQTGNPKLTCRNWECGVVVPSTSSDSPTTAAGTGQEEGLSCFLGRIPVPIVWPSEAYGKNGSRRPWFFLENR